MPRAECSVTTRQSLCCRVRTTWPASSMRFNRIDVAPGRPRSSTASPSNAPKLCLHQTRGETHGKDCHPHDRVALVAVREEHSDEVRDLPPPPRERLLDQLRRYYRSRLSLSGLQFWILFRGLPTLAAAAALFVACGIVIGWRTAYDVTLGITSPADTRVPTIAWMLSLGGWLVAPSVAGAVAGHIVTTYIERRQRPVTSLFDEETSG
ncbi:DUF6313 family protein [Actinoplanes sp. NPDC051851]|uniref:DUF6313 family protein n=1 Tax=Actinoplanes sp. NPDC051851 TaxID=3154753 RepID=UPI00342BF191